MQIKTHLETTRNNWNQAGQIAIVMTPENVLLISLSWK